MNNPVADTCRCQHLIDPWQTIKWGYLIGSSFLEVSSDLVGAIFVGGNVVDDDSWEW